MIVLDTDHISVLRHPQSQEASVLTQRLAASSDRDIATTVATLEEQMRAWLSVIARYRDLQRQAPYYDRLVRFVRFFNKWRILPLGEPAIAEFRRLRKARIRIATTDLKIAAITLAVGGTLLSRNLRDFEQVPALRVEDWTRSA
jgi:tRNA(fMet)-specific endonuclease VapC